MVVCPLPYPLWYEGGPMVYGVMQDSVLVHQIFWISLNNVLAGALLARKEKPYLEYMLIPVKMNSFILR